MKSHVFSCLPSKDENDTLTYFRPRPVTWREGRGPENYGKLGGTDMSDMAGTGPQGHLVGLLDVVVIGGVLATALYWFVFKKKKEEVPDVRNLSVVPTLARSASYDPSFVNKMMKSGRNVVVFYGSQTGTAEEFAGRLAKDAARYGLKGMVADPEECEMEDLSKLTELESPHLAIFCMATYGEGDPTDNAQEFFNWMDENQPDLNGINFAVFGLGNKTYEHYNKMGVHIDKKLEEFGATRVFELGLGDDDGNIEEDFLNWRERFWPAVCEHFGIEATGEDINTRQYSLKLHDDIPKEKVFTGEAARIGSFRNQKPPHDAKNPFLAPVQVNKELHNASSTRSCMHIEFDITGSKIRYEAGDHVAVYPLNSAETVDKLGQRLETDLDQVFSLINVDEDASKKHPFPCPTTYRTALMHYLDISCNPRTNVLKELAEYATEESEKEFLLKMTNNTPEGKEVFNNWILKDMRSIVQVLEDLPSVKPPIDHLCELLPRLQPRYYSISSSPKVHPNSIHVTAILTEWNTPTKRHVQGVATSWLKTKLPVNEQKPTVPIYVRKSQFRLPFKSSVPVIMIGPGTGIAPFRGFIQDRNKAREEGKPIGDTILFTGCRNKAVDYIYEDELTDYQEKGTLSDLFVAFSRDQGEKVYVQHLINNECEKVWKLIDGGGHLYVCGDARYMANDVDKSLINIVSKYGEMDATKASEYLKKMRSRGRYSCDVWS